MKVIIKHSFKDFIQIIIEPNSTVLTWSGNKQAIATSITSMTLSYNKNMNSIESEFTKKTQLSFLPVQSHITVILKTGHGY